MAEARPCPMDCTRCGLAQHAFCAAKMIFEQSKVINEIRETLSKIEEKIGSDLSLPQTDISQEGSGEERRLPKPKK